MSMFAELLARVRRQNGNSSPTSGEAERARRLAHAFETCGTGWFWETDARGRITYISSTFGTALGTAPQSLTGKPLADLIAASVAGDEDKSADARSLAFHLQAQLPFHEVTVPVHFPVGTHWWSLSGVPIYGRRGFSGFTGIGTDLTDIRRSEDRALQLARFDSLTGLANRSAIQETLETALSQPGPEAMRCAVLLLDLDRFKLVNDTLGHPVGDTLLKQVAGRLESMMGSDGRVGRLGGDEFAIIVREKFARRQLSALARRMIDYLSAPYTIDGHRIVIGASAGIAASPEDGETVDTLIRNADLALYAAKAAGRNRHQHYHESMHREAELRRQLENDLRAAVTQGALSVVYQPLVDTGSEKLVGFEALARWQHPRLGDIPPSKFIPIAEEAGLIAQVGEWVMRSACAAAAKWPANVAVAVNLSPLQFASPDLAAIVVNALAQAGLPAERLELEITEGVFLQDDAATTSTLQRLSTLGIKLTLDDFGTGYSSLGYLHRAPFTKIKIDRSFVAGASERDDHKASIIKAIVALADSLGMVTTAEGVETQSDLAIVRKLGCTQVQGFIFGKAIDAADANRMASGQLQIMPSGHKATRSRRVAMLRRAVVLHNGRKRSVRLRNHSATGAMFEANWAPAVGDRIHVTIDREKPVWGIVRWVQNGSFGLLFDETCTDPPYELPQTAFERAANAA